MTASDGVRLYVVAHDDAAELTPDYVIDHNEEGVYVAVVVMNILRARLDAAERERDSLRQRVERMTPHLRHRWDCASLVVESRERGVHDPRDPCNCGLEAALKET
jgi:hypothetical protein